jgi:putative hydrolase of the HAD superfamily
MASSSCSSRSPAPVTTIERSGYADRPSQNGDNQASCVTYRPVGTIATVADHQRIDAVVFDYGGVLTTPLRVSTPLWLAADRISPNSFADVMREWLGRDAPIGTPIHRLETGELSVGDFERLFAERLTTTDGSPLTTEGLLSRLFAGMRTDHAMYDLINDLRATGRKVGLLSNSWGNHYPENLHDLFDAVVISGEVGLRKPDPVIYGLILDKLAVEPTRCVFVDDAPINLTAATELGMHTIRHRDADETRAALQRWIPELASKDVTT